MLILAIVIVVSVFAILAKWLINDRAEMGRRLTEVTDRHIAQGHELGVLVANNTIAMNRSAEVMDRVVEVIGKCNPQGNTDFRHRKAGA